MQIRVFAILLLFSLADAEVYSYKNSQGYMVISNNPQNNAKKITLSPLKIIKYANSKKQILIEELLYEKKLLANSNTILEQTKIFSKNNQEYYNRINMLKDDITEHNKNIVLLNRALEDIK